MGVQGLSSFIVNSQIYRDVQFRDSRLVIDGSNFCYLLYFSSGLNQRHGGEYGAFADLIERFVKALSDCKIQPYVVLDGGADITGKKARILTQRAAAGIRTAHKMAVGEKECDILPPLAKLLFMQTLARLQVPVAQCFIEADQQIAALASEWKCPVLSSDSDFYIFDLPAGLLPFSHFRWKEVVQTRSQSSIPCKSYTASSFCTFFNIQRQILPAFAVLAGNDYVKLGLASRRRHPTPVARGTGRAGDLESLLGWLSGFDQPKEALDKVLHEILQALFLGMEEYQLPPSYLNRFFTDETVPPLPPEAQGLVPDWARLPLTQGRLTKETLNVLLPRTMHLPIMVEHGNQPSANLISRPVRQVMYGLLLGDGQEVEETDREGLQLHTEMVQSARGGAAQQLSLDSLDTAEPSLRLQVFLEALRVNRFCLRDLDPQLRLLVAVTRYWLQKSSPPPDLLQALLLGLVTQRATLQVENTHSAHTLDHDVAHAFNQWQACLKDSILLNQVLGRPLPEPPVARLYQGTLVHQLVHRLRGGTQPESLLEAEASSLKLYQTLLDAVLQSRAEETTSSSAAARGGEARQQHNTHTPDDLLVPPEENQEVTAAGNSTETAEEDSDWTVVSNRRRKRGKR